VTTQQAKSDGNAVHEPTAHMQAQTSSSKSAATAPDVRHANAGRIFAANCKILVLEDDYVIGLELAAAPARDGFKISGPHLTAASALTALRDDADIAAAILDLNLNGKITFDLAAELMARAIPFVFYTGYESAIVPDEFHHIRRVRKPAPWADIRAALEQMAAQKARDAADAAPHLPENRNFLSLLPLLRQRARELTPNGFAAETLVEKTLARAIEQIEKCPADTAVECWLVKLLETTGIGEPTMLN